MDNFLQQREEIVEQICQLGCRTVNQLLNSQQLQQEHDLLKKLDDEGLQWVLSELDAVMNVYSDSGSCTI